jgi:hypothetical protein
VIKKLREIIFHSDRSSLNCLIKNCFQIIKKNYFSINMKALVIARTVLCFYWNKPHLKSSIALTHSHTNEFINSPLISYFYFYIHDDDKFFLLFHFIASLCEKKFFIKSLSVFLSKHPALSVMIALRMKFQNICALISFCDPRVKQSTET